MEGDVDTFGTALSEYMELRKSLKTLLLEESTATIEDVNAAETLRKISSDDKLPSDKIFDLLAADVGEDISNYEFDDVEVDELGSEMYYSWYSHHEYQIKALSELRPLLLRSPASENVEQQVRQAKHAMPSSNTARLTDYAARRRHF